jgi:hypothetical protein
VLLKCGGIGKSLRSGSVMHSVGVHRHHSRQLLLLGTVHTTALPVGSMCCFSTVAARSFLADLGIVGRSCFGNLRMCVGTMYSRTVLVGMETPAACCFVG